MEKTASIRYPLIRVSKEEMDRVWRDDVWGIPMYYEQEDAESPLRLYPLAYGDLHLERRDDELFVVIDRQKQEQRSLEEISRGLNAAALRKADIQGRVGRLSDRKLLEEIWLMLFDRQDR